MNCKVRWKRATTRSQDYDRSYSNNSSYTSSSSISSKVVLQRSGRHMGHPTTIQTSRVVLVVLGIEAYQYNNLLSQVLDNSLVDCLQ
eukprot:3478452-Amphidinium_carterae.1